MATSFSEAVTAAATQTPFEHDGELYRHSKRPQWGIAILAWDHGDVRAYQFEDGRLRKFKKGYFKLMETVDEVRGSRESLVTNLTAAVKSKRNRDDDAEELDPVAPFKAQVELFLKIYPGGFQDDEWIAEHRGRDSGSDLKRHREPVIQAVRDNLSADQCQEYLQDENFGGLVESVRSILSRTDLVSLTHIRVLKGLDPDEEKAVAESIADLLHGDEDFKIRFRGYVRVLTDIIGTRPSWRMATVLPALAFPQDHVCVRHSAFLRQAASISPKSKYSRQARVGPYQSFRQVAIAVRKRLQAAGQEPRDLLDVYDFVWTTLRSAALEHLTD
jgi:hypothetical protein